MLHSTNGQTVTNTIWFEHQIDKMLQTKG